MKKYRAQIRLIVMAFVGKGNPLTVGEPNHEIDYDVGILATSRLSTGQLFAHTYAFICSDNIEQIKQRVWDNAAIHLNEKTIRDYLSNAKTGNCSPLCVGLTRASGVEF